jgi:hypothetical protein
MTSQTQQSPIEKVRNFLNSGGTMIAGSSMRGYKLTKKNLAQLTEAKGGFNIQHGKSSVFVYFGQCTFYR